MEAEHLPDEPRWGSEHVNDLWEDMDTLNMLYEELCWDHDDVLEFVPDYKNDRIIIKNRSKEDEKLNDQT
tara:strand:- start:284 stop:493 length:210 start_codon:yes stop_codon:yes gene_type:complete